MDCCHDGDGDGDGDGDDNDNGGDRAWHGR